MRLVPDAATAVSAPSTLKSLKLMRRNKEAIELCQEVIRLAPNAADAYHTIGTIQEAMGNPRKALDFYMIAAHLPPKVRECFALFLGSCLFLLSVVRL